ncbi:cardiolipin synthase [Fusibacter paucivorans]|uniref:Cardiolipin synthase n=1 Tax=Fusibacter paucivorans TaxID=76009 RepID=A0ABS5PQ09_9FIRM|nr:cardiolipin synthase [Fusibacter paucivorans]
MERQIKRAIALILLVLIAAGLVFVSYEALLYYVQFYPWLEWVPKVLDTLFRINIVWIGLVIFLENSNPSRTVAWLLVLTLLPLLGFVLYVLFGRSYRKKYRSEAKHLRDSEQMLKAAEIQRSLLDIIELPHATNPYNKRLVHLLLQNAHAPFAIRNEVKVLTNGIAKFNQLIEAIERAEHHIHIEYFIIKNDQIGNEIRRLLIAKSNEGVKVRLIYDAVGSWKLTPYYLDSLKRAGVEVFAFFPVAFPLLSRDLNYRNHRKIAVIDGKVGFVGGLNIGDEYLGMSDKFKFWRDTHLEIKGEGVYAIQTIFLNDWNFVSNQMLTGATYYPQHHVQRISMLQIAASGPDSEWQSILQAYYKMIASANDKIWITTPYLVPEDSLMMGLKTAALSGVDVRIIIPSQPDHFFVYWASRANIEPLLKAGVKIYRYNNGFIHSKIMIVDRLSATVGTANLDIRSMEINFEINAFIYDEEVIIRLEEDFIRDLEDCREFILESFEKRPFRERFLEALGRLVSPLQ